MFIRLTTGIVAAAVLGSLAAPSVFAQVIQNGDFENVILGGTLSSNAADVPGWTHFGAAGDALIWKVGYSDTGGSITTAGSGQQFVTMGGGFGNNGTGGWTTDITSLIVGQTYRVDFMMASETGNLGQTIGVDFAAGSSTALQNFSAAASSANYWRNWESKSLNFVASAATATIRFSSTTQQDVGLDNVRVRQVVTGAPEASTMALIAAGLPLVGIALRRRRSL